MPGSVVAANPVVAMPWRLARLFERSQSWDLYQNRYKNGEVQSRNLTSTSRKQWGLGSRYTPAYLTEILSFWDSMGGGLTEFGFYDVFETDPKFSYDDTMEATDGLYAVRFNGPWQTQLRIGHLTDSSLALVEVS